MCQTAIVHLDRLLYIDIGLRNLYQYSTGGFLYHQHSYCYCGSPQHSWGLNLELKGQFDVEPRFYAASRGEIDFLIQNGMEIIPIEVKAGENKSAASFKSYIKNLRPRVAIRYSKRGYAIDGAIANMPLYLAGKTRELV